MRNKLIPRNFHVDQLIRFGAIGMLTNLIGYSLFLTLTILLEFSPYLAVSFLYPLSISTSYVLNKNHTFRKSSPQKKQKIIFLSIYFSMYVLNIFILFIAENLFFIPSYLGQGIAVILLAIYSFIMQKKYVYV